MTRFVWKFRWFWDDADHVIERWLDEMARNGLHLHRVGALRMVFIFKRGEPADMSYRIDFRMLRTDPHYLQLFKDAGWEHAQEHLGWHYWRAPSGSMRVAEIFTDTASMTRKYKRLLLLFAVPMMVYLPITLMRIQEKWDKEPASLAMVLGAFMLSLYCMARLVRRIRSLQKQG